LTDSHAIREVVLFPLLRTEGREPEEPSPPGTSGEAK
jgi:hypothetical protein